MKKNKTKQRKQKVIVGVKFILFNFGIVQFLISILIFVEKQMAIWEHGLYLLFYNPFSISP